MAGPGDVTLVENAVHNPDEPRHFMRAVPAKRSYSAAIDAHDLATSTTATIVKEVGRDIYDAVVYFPRDDVDMSALKRIDKSTHCPIKGDTEYFDVVVGENHLAEAAWSYVDIVEGAEQLRHQIAFDTTRIRVS